ncbi:MAG: hypothetical protein ACXADU_12310, partial [Promethearchaeota archaeon]
MVDEKEPDEKNSPVGDQNKDSEKTSAHNFAQAMRDIEKLRPSRIKRELIPLILISLITLSSFIYFSYQDSTGSIVYSSEVPNINI